MSVNARRELADRIRQRERVWYDGAYVKYTQTTIGLLNAILERIDRQTGKAEIAYSVLHEVTGIVSRQTLARHVYLLEKAGCIAVTRGVKVARDRNATNCYRLVGDTALAFLGAGWSPKGILSAKNRTDNNQYDSRTDIKQNSDDDGCKDNPILEKVAEKLKTILDADVAERVASQHDGAYLMRLAEWVEAQRWVNNKGGIFMVKLRAKFVPPEGLAVADEPKPIVEYRKPEPMVIDEPDSIEPMVRLRSGFDTPPPQPKARLVNVWDSADTPEKQTALHLANDFYTWACLKGSPYDYVQCEIDGKVVIVRYDWRLIFTSKLNGVNLSPALVEHFMRRKARYYGYENVRFINLSEEKAVA